MKKIGTLKGIPVVEGNVNEVTKNQIHYKENGEGIQLSKRDNENKLNSITSSSDSGGGEVKEYYYRCKEIDGYHQPVLGMILQVANPVYNIMKYENYFIDAPIIISNEMSDVNYTEYVKLIDIPYLMYEVTDGDIVNIYGILKGSLKERITKFCTITGQEVTEEMYNTLVQEITKEEYESMITYKPE